MLSSFTILSCTIITTGYLKGSTTCEDLYFTFLTTSPISSVELVLILQLQALLVLLALSDHLNILLVLLASLSGKSGLGYSKVNKPCTSKTFFVMKNDQSNKEKVNKEQKVHYYHKRKRFANNKSYTPRYISNFVPTCFYCGIVGHTPNACYVRNFSMENGHYV